MQLLRRVRSHTSTAIKAWKEFSAHNRDMRFLHSHDDHKAKLSFNKIRDLFFNLAIVDEKLVALDKTCEESAKIAS
jgi:transcription initiation factor IIE alpha subunit